MQDTETLELCSLCGDEIPEDEGMHHNGEWYCDSCFDAEFAECPDCGMYVERDDLCIVNPGVSYGHRTEQEVCSECFDNYTECSDCGGRFHEYEIYMNGTYERYCEVCSRDRTRCYDCGDIICTDDACYDEDEDAYRCESCEASHNRRAIRSYSYKPYPIFFGDMGENSSSTLYLGVELEVDGGDDYAPDVAERINAYAPEVYMKHDGSLNDGFEIVSHPATLEYHMGHLRWDEIARCCLEGGYKSHQTSTCGLHVHVNKLYFGSGVTTQDLSVAKLLLTVDRLWDQLVVLSRRRYSQLEQWSRKCELGFESHDTSETLVMKADAQKHKGRYYAVNLENDETVEFRMFRGTLLIPTFMATLQLVERLCNFAKRSTVPEVQAITWDKFKQFSAARSELAAYISLRRL